MLIFYEMPYATQQNIHGSVTGCGRQHPVTDLYTLRYRPGKVHVAYGCIYTDLCSTDTIQIWYRSVIRVGNRCVIVRTVYTCLYGDVKYRYGTGILYISVTDMLS